MSNQEQSPTPRVVPALTALMADADAPKDITGQPGRIRPVTWTLLAVVAVFVALGATGGELAFLWYVLAVPFALGLLTAVIQDLVTPAVRGRDTPQAAAQCHVKWLRHGNWARAYACLRPETLPQTEPLPVIDRLRVVPTMITRQTIAGFKRYWRALTGSKDGIVRRIRGVQLSTLSARDGECVRTAATLTVEVYSSMIYAWLLLGVIPMLIAYLITRKRVRVELELLLYHHRSQWWVLPGAPRDRDATPSLPRARLSQAAVRRGQ